MPEKRIGLPTISRIDSAAPPRASPSRLVRTISGESELAIKTDGLIHGVLPGHRVGDEENLMRSDGIFDGAQLLHQLFVNMQTSRGVDQKKITKLPLRLFQCLLANRHGRLFWIGVIDRQLELAAENFQLLDGRGGIDVGRDKVRATLLFFL